MSQRTDVSEPSRATLVKQAGRRAAVIVVTVALLYFLTFGPSPLDGYRRVRGILAVITFGIGLWQTMPTAVERERYERWKLRR